MKNKVVILTFVFVSVVVLQAKLLREVKRNLRLKVALRNARCDTRFPRRKRYFLRRR